MIPTKENIEKIMQQKIQPYKKISNTFIQNAIANSNTCTLKIIYYLSIIIEKYDYSKEYNRYSINLKDMLKYTGLTSQNVRDNIKKMQTTSITFIDENNNIESGISLLPKYHFHWNKNIVEIVLDKKICTLIVDVMKQYTFININDLMKLKSKNSIRLLPLLHTINNYDVKRKRLTISELNAFFGTNYKAYELERSLLIKVKKELDSNSKLTFNYEINFDNFGRGRPKATSITLFPKDLNKTKNNDKKIEKKDIKELDTIKKIKEWQPNLNDMDLTVEYGIAQTNNVTLITNFEWYLEEQVIAFKRYCIENKKDYKNMDISFKRHIKGAYDNKIDFFSTHKF